MRGCLFTLVLGAAVIALSFTRRSSCSSNNCLSSGFMSISVASRYTSRSGSSMPETIERKSGDRPVASENAFSTRSRSVRR